MLSDRSTSSGHTNIRQKAAADRDAIYTSIVNGIRNGEFAEGSKLPTERELSESFGAARNAVRQALDALVREGTVSRQVGRGTFVTGQTGTDAAPDALGANLSLQEILEVRLLLEPQIARLVVERAGDGDFAAMERCLDGIRGARDWSEYKEWKYELHLTMMRATGNRFLVQIFEAIIRSRRQDQWGRAGDTSMIPDDVRAATLRANEHIVEALQEGRNDEAADAIRRYLNEILASFHGI